MKDPPEFDLIKTTGNNDPDAKPAPAHAASEKTDETEAT